MKITMIGPDIAKCVFQVDGVDAAGRAVLRRKLGRSEVLDFFRTLPPCLVGIEACGTAHHWARELRTLGHEVRLPAARTAEVATEVEDPLKDDHPGLRFAAHPGVALQAGL